MKKNICLAITALIVSGCSQSYLYFPDKNIYYPSVSSGIVIDDVWFTAGDGVKLNAWYVVSKKNRGTILFCHGNGGNISHYAEQIIIFNGLGFNVLFFDYRGYGKSEGEPTVEGTYLDAAAAWNFLVRDKGLSPESVIVWGRSLGGPVAAHLASSVACGAYVAESTFSTLSAEVSDTCCIAPVFVMPGKDYRTVDFVKNIRCPVLVIHSFDDTTVPYYHGKKIYEAADASGRKAFLDIRGTHNGGYYLSRDEYSRGIDAFMKKYFDARGESE